MNSLPCPYVQKHVEDMSWHIVWHITVILWPWTNMLISLKIMSIHLLIFDLIKSIRTRTKNHFRTYVCILNHSKVIELFLATGIPLAGKVRSSKDCVRSLQHNNNRWLYSWRFYRLIASGSESYNLWDRKSVFFDESNLLYIFFCKIRVKIIGLFQ